jgi:uncharacterized protein (DUF58 family)
MNRLAYRIYRVASWLRYWSARRLTPAGWIALTAVALTGGMATDTDQSLGYQSFALLVCLWLVALFATPLFRVRFAAERLLPRFCTAGQPLRYSITVRNLGSRAETGLEVIDTLADPRPTFEEFLAKTKPTKKRRSLRLSRPLDLRRVLPLKPESLPPLLPNAETTVEMQLVPLRRGALNFSQVTVARTDPFGLFRAFRHTTARDTIVVLPKRYRLPQIALPGTSQYQHGGVAFASSVGESEEFVALRDYRPGDPMRHIHWRSWAKAGRPVVKEFQDEFFMRHALILDTFIEPDEVEVFEEAVSVAASFACTIDTQESLLDLLFIGTEAFTFTIGRGVAHADQMLELLASVRVSASQSFSALEELVVEHAAAVSGCICILLDWDEPRRKMVRRLRDMNVPVLVFVLQANGAVPLARSANDPEAMHTLRVGQIEQDLVKI